MLARFMFLAVLLLATGFPALADDACSRDSLSIEGTQVAAVLCAPAQAKPAAGPITVNATFSAKGQSFSKSFTLDVLPGEEQSRGIEEIALAPLGLNRSLYMTVTYRGGRVALAHAVLLPGAITLK